MSRDIQTHVGCKMAAKRKLNDRDSSAEGPKSAGDEEEFYIDVRSDIISLSVAHRLIVKLILLLRAVELLLRIFNLNCCSKIHCVCYSFCRTRVRSS